MTLGPALLALAWLDREPGRIGRAFVVFGRNRRQLLARRALDDEATSWGPVEDLTPGIFNASQVDVTPGPGSGIGFPTAAGGTRRLGVDAGDFVASLDQRGEGGNREIGRSHEDQALRGHGRGRMRQASDGGFGTGLFQFAQLAQDHAALEAGDMIDEQHAVEVVDLVLDTGTEKAVDLDFADLVLPVDVSDTYHRRPFDLGEMLRKRQTALFDRGDFI